MRGPTILTRPEAASQDLERWHLKIAVLRLLRLLDQLAPRVPVGIQEEALEVLRHAHGWAGVPRDVWSPWREPADIVAVEHPLEP
jgi:hypothetical protein